MFIAIVGPRYSGKSTVESYLVTHKGFIPLRLTSGSSSASSIIDAPDLEADPMRSAWTRSPNPSQQELDQFPVPPDKTTSKQHLSFLSLSPVTPHVAWSEDPSKPLSFTHTIDMLNYVTLNWSENFVTVDLSTRDLVEEFIRRPFFMLINIDAPTLVRYSRAPEHEHRSLEDFIRENDEIFFGSSKNSKEIGLRSLHDLVNININNDFCHLSELHAHVEGLGLLDPQHLRPSWDAYFMTLASLASRRSNCMKRRVGAILVRDNRILATGYNGTPRGLKNCNEGGCNRCNGIPSPFSSSEDECVCLHAEENALLEAGRERVGEDATLYCDTCPCLKCTVKIIQTGVKRVVYNLSYKVDDASALLFQQAGVELRRFNPSQKLHLATADDSLETRTLLLSPARGPN